MNTSTSQPPPLAERSDVHKSCKSLEVVVNLLNDYCEAAGAVVQLQKKLAKAIRDIAHLKSTPDIAGNTFGACALILEALSEVDNKFAKLADRECENLSSDVRKWFKKLAKEEKAHDDRIAQASAKLKQAGVSYEKKAKKSPREAAEEHSRYLTLVGTLGPEMTQDKYNHAVFVSQKHTTTTVGVAASLARIADAEWLRSCESVRRFAPTVGQLGELRAYCEGGWTRPRPPDLEAANNTLREPSYEQRTTSRPVSRNDDRPPSRVEEDSQGVFNGGGSEPQHLPITPLEPPATPEQARTSPSASPRVSAREPLYDIDGSKSASSSGGLNNHANTPISESESPRRLNGGQRSSTSLTSLAAFPPPPTHFPIPAVSSPTGHRPPSSVSGNNTPNFGSGSESSARSPLSAPRTSSVSFATMPSVIESPRPQSIPSEPQTPVPDAKMASSAYPFPRTQDEKRERNDALMGEFEEEDRARPLVMEDLRPTATSKPATSPEAEQPSTPIEPLSPSDTGTAKGSTTSGSQSGHGSSNVRRGDYLNEREFGVERPHIGVASKSMDAIRGKHTPRTESMHSNSSSMVAAMRGRFSHTKSPASPPPRDLPRLAQSVNEMANKYRTPEPTPHAPLRRTTSPPADFGPPSAYRHSDQPMDAPRTSLGGSTSSRPDLGASTSSDDLARRRYRLDELEEMEIREREYELRQKEREIEHRARELDRERARLVSARSGTAPVMEGFTGDSMGGRARGDQMPPRGRFSSSATHLALPSMSSRTTSSTQLSSSPTSTPGGGPNDHAPYCGCAACSTNKYGRQEQAPSAHDLRPPEAPINLRPQNDKPKGWMRRLSMPVGAAFNLNDSKKTSSPGLNRNSMSFAPEDDRSMRRTMDPKSPGNRSVASFTRR